MHEFGLAFVTAFHLIADLDPGLVGIVTLSLRVSLTAVLLSALIGLPLAPPWRPSAFRDGAR